MEFISSIFKNLAWPAVILIAAIKLKEPLSNLINTIAKIKYKEWEIEFQLDKRLDKITALATENEKIDQLESENKIIGDEEIDRTPLTGFVLSSVGSGKTATFLAHLLKQQEHTLDQLISKIYYFVSNDTEGHNPKAITYMITYLTDEGIFSEDLAESIHLVKQMKHDFYRMKTPIPDFLRDKYMSSINLVIRRLNSILNNLREKSSE